MFFVSIVGLSINPNCDVEFLLQLIQLVKQVGASGFVILNCGNWILYQPPLCLHLHQLLNIYSSSCYICNSEFVCRTAMLVYLPPYLDNFHNFSRDSLMRTKCSRYPANLQIMFVLSTREYWVIYATITW